MNAAMLAFVTLCLVAPFVFFTIYARRDTMARLLSVATLVLIVPPLLAEHVGALGNPLPASVATYMPWRKPGHMQVLGSKVVIGKGIFVMLDSGGGTPLYLQLPWDKDVAKQLQDAEDSSGGAIFSGGTDDKGAPSWNTRPQFLPIPLPPMQPPKARPPAPKILDDSKTI